MAIKKELSLLTDEVIRKSERFADLRKGNIENLSFTEQELVEKIQQDREGNWEGRRLSEWPEYSVLANRLNELKSKSIDYTGVIELIGPIISDADSDIYKAYKMPYVSLEKFLEGFNRFELTNPLTVVIETNGGDFISAYQIYAYLKSHLGKVTVIIDNYADSGGSVIALAGDEVFLSSNATMTIHNARMVNPTISHIDGEVYQDYLQNTNRILRETYLTRMNVNETILKEMLAKDTKLSAQEAVRFGLADSIYEKEYVVC